MPNYVRCECCGALCTVEGMPDFIGDNHAVTQHYAPACDALVRELAKTDIRDEYAAWGKLAVFWAHANMLVEAMNDD